MKHDLSRQNNEFKKKEWLVAGRACGKYIPKDSQEYRKIRVKNTVSTVYWLGTTAIYLGWSGFMNAWGSTWVVWPIAWILFGIVMCLLNLFIDRDKGLHN